MKDFHNNLINKYLDKELDTTDIENVEKLIQTDNNFKVNLSVQNYVHETLYKLPIKNAPQGITERIMKQIVNKLSERYKKNYLFRGVISVLTIILVVSLFIFFLYVGDLSFVKSVSDSTGNYSNIFTSVFAFLNKIVNNDIFRTISGLLGFIILLGFYFNFNSHKNLKDTLEKY